MIDPSGRPEVRRYRDTRKHYQARTRDPGSNPERGWIATANNDIHPIGWEPRLFYTSQTSFPRMERLADVLGSGANFTMEDMQALQLDSYSAAADQAHPMFPGWTSEDPDIERARSDLAEWDAFFEQESRAAAIWSEVEDALPDEIRDPSLSQTELHRLLEGAIAEGLAELRDDPAEWRWGRIQRSEFPNRLVSAWDIPAVERSGRGGLIASTGATYRHIVDFSDLDQSVFTNAPGQSARPGSPYYDNLAASWGAGEYLPMLYTREAVEARAENRLLLRPGG